MSRLVAIVTPFFDRTIGVTPWRCVTVELMHTLHLGVILAFAKVVVWEMLTAGYWVGGETLDETVSANILMCSREWRKWHKQYHRDHT